MTPSCLRLCEESKRLTPILVFENQTGKWSTKIPFLFRGGQAPGREANARQQDSVVCEQKNRCRFLNVVSRGETPRAAKRSLTPCSSRLLMIMTVMQFRQVRVIMGEGEVPMHVSMRFLKDRVSIVHVVVMLFVLMAVVMFDFLMPVCMRVGPA
jgi:hypothetical protein